MIRAYAIAVLVIPLACSTTWAQKPEMNLFYTLKLIEFRPTASMLETGTSPTKIVGIFRQLEETQELDVVQVLRIATMENTEGTLRIESEPASRSSNQRERAEPQQPAVSTIAQVRFAKQGDHILVTLDYDSLRSVGDDENPRIHKTMLQSTLQIEPGKPTFVGGSHGEDATFVIAVLEP